MKTMIKNLLVITALVLISSLSMHAQQLGGTGLYQQGSDLGGTGLSYESIDSVTLGSTLQYYVQPSPAISPSYVYTSPLANLNSTFAWTAAPAASATITSPMNGTVLTNWITVKWTTLGSVNLSVVETAITGTCAGSTTTIPVDVIHVPTITGGAAPAAQCASNPATLTFTVPFTLTSDLSLPSTVRVNYTVNNPDGSTLIAAQNVELAKSATTISVPLTGAIQFGAYKVVFNSVSDRISRKSSVAGTVTTPNVLLTVNPVPVTGPIYHLPNL
jgi:hypothetical protein